MTSKAARRRAKESARARAAEMGLPELAPTTKRKPCGNRRQTEEDPRLTVQQARCRMMGWDGSKESLRAALDEMLTCDPGRAIHKLRRSPEEGAHLWGLFATMLATYCTYYTRVMGNPLWPAVSKMEFLPERMEARADDRPDTRTEDEKVKDAIRAWREWERHLAKLPGPHLTAVNNAIFDRAQMIRDGWATTAGASFVEAMRTLRGIVSA